MFALLGIAGGLVGAAFNSINIRCNAIRMTSNYKERIGPVLETSIVAVLTLVSSWPLALTRPLNQLTIHAMFDTFSPEPGETVRGQIQTQTGLCTHEGYFSEADAALLACLGLAA